MPNNVNEKTPIVANPIVVELSSDPNKLHVVGGALADSLAHAVRSTPSWYFSMGGYGPLLPWRSHEFAAFNAWAEHNVGNFDPANWILVVDRIAEDPTSICTTKVYFKMRKELPR